MTRLSPESQISRCLEQGETLSWAGKPDTKAFLKGLFTTGFGANNVILGNPLPRRIVAFFAFGAVIAILITWLVRKGILIPMEFSQLSPIYVGLFISLFVLAAFRKSSALKSSSWNGRERDYVESLTYGITSQRLLILRDGIIENEFTVSEVHPKLLERKNAPGFSDIIWGGRQWGQGGGSDSRSTTSPFERELNRVGFKALADAEIALQRIDSWREAHVSELAEQGQAFINSREQPATTEERQSAPSEETQPDQSKIIGREITNTTLGFSIECPKEWSVKVRKRRLAFGKWGLEKEAVWSDEDELSKWNVLCVESSLGTKLEVQVHKTQPINTFEKLVSANVGVAGVSELIDKNPAFTVNGLKGFYITRQTGGDSVPFVGNLINIPVTLTRYHVFHDGQRQFYVESTWSRDAPAEGALCEAIVSTLKG